MILALHPSCRWHLHHEHLSPHWTRLVRDLHATTTSIYHRHPHHDDSEDGARRRSMPPVLPQWINLDQDQEGEGEVIPQDTWR